MNRIQAFTWNLRTYDFDVKGNAQCKNLVSAKVPMRNIGAELSVVVMKLL